MATNNRPGAEPFVPENLVYPLNDGMRTHSPDPSYPTHPSPSRKGTATVPGSDSLMPSGPGHDAGRARTNSGKNQT